MAERAKLSYNTNKNEKRTEIMLEEIRENIKKVMIGNEHTIDLVLTCMLAQGHVLLEDVPGTGKTVLAKSMARSIDGEFRRISFTPDMLPSDVTGLNYFDSGKSQFVFSPGPVFANILLADEINRATPKTQSSLLECMAEQQVTVDGVTRKLEDPFLVIATENPLENLGTFPLPEAQLDRFLMRISMEELTREQECAMVDRFLTGEPLQQLESVCGREDIVHLQEACRNITIHEELKDYMVRVIHATRKHSLTACGASPRSTIAFVRAAQGYAMVCGRDFVTPEDIKAVAVPVLAHRLILSVAGDGEKTAVKVLEDILASEPLPTEKW